ncbi:triosephosphate isomerase [Chryseomicrobium aureum]|uniref:triose-phosphate isomerase n=1 Tax=Chryseomicrobium aureum TaxID=1441723 RepID=UPI001956B616|nr:triose-phosphate isomerase [Chryseomicrobium aureum]MBM7707212.1 triosephosphate isomerase [Chryseomicrobium aureum]
MRKPVIAGNWKMFKTVGEAHEFWNAASSATIDASKVDAVICAPFLQLPALVEAAKGSSIHIGAQNMHQEKEGAFTGEISGDMLKDVGVTHVVIGHSERRQYFNETDETVNLKTKAALDLGLTPIVCVGESLEQREAGETETVVSKQVAEAFEGLTESEVEKTVVAYEPIWAIGTGKTATADDANQVCQAIRETLLDLHGEEAANATRILYGGSVKPANIEELLGKEDIDGALVGGASLEADSFLQLVEATQK